MGQPLSCNRWYVISRTVDLWVDTDRGAAGVRLLALVDGLTSEPYAGIIWSNGDSWREMRRFALSNLKNFGMGRKVCEEKIIEESRHLIGVLKNFRGEYLSLPLQYQDASPEGESLFSVCRRSRQHLSASLLCHLQRYLLCGLWQQV